MKLVELNLFKKIIKKLFPKADSIFLADDFRRIEKLFKEKVNLNKTNLYKNLFKFFYPFWSFNFFFYKKNSKENIIKAIYQLLIHENNSILKNKLIINLSFKNKLRLYRLLIFLKHYKEAHLMRLDESFSKIFKHEDSEISNFKRKLINLKEKSINKSIAVIGPLNDIDKYKDELNNYDHLLIINPSNNFKSKEYKNSKFAFYYRTPSIDAIEKLNFKPPKLTPIFIVTEKKIRKFSHFYKLFNSKFDMLSHRYLIKEKKLVGKLNAIQSIILHLLEIGYKDIGIYGCDLFLTPRNINKRKDYAPYQVDLNLKMKKNDQYNHLMCHEPYLNFILLKILFEMDLINPYKPLREILSYSYNKYLSKLERIVKS